MSHLLEAPETHELPDTCEHGKRWDEDCEACEMDLDADPEEDFLP